MRGVAVAGGFRLGAGASIRTLVLVSLPRGARLLPSAKPKASAPTMHKFRGSITRPVHSLSTLRSFPPSAEVVRPRKTRSRLVVNLGRVGLVTHKVPSEVSAFSTSASSSPRALPGAMACLFASS